MIDLVSFPETLPDGASYEIDEGEIIRLSPTNFSHGVLVVRIGTYLRSNLPDSKYDVVAGEVGFILHDVPTTLRAPDVAVVPHQNEPPETFFAGPPMLAVEIVSPGNSPEDIEKKRIQYLEAGAQEIWVVYPKTKTIHVFQHRNSKTFVVAKGDQFTSTLDDLTVDVSKLFG